MPDTPPGFAQLQTAVAGPQRLNNFQDGSVDIQTSSRVQAYKAWKKGRFDLHARAFVWDSRRGERRSWYLKAAFQVLHSSLTALAVTQGKPDSWCIWLPLDSNRSWQSNPNPQRLPQEMPYRVQVCTPHATWQHTVVFTSALHEAFGRALWKQQHTLPGITTTSEQWRHPLSPNSVQQGHPVELGAFATQLSAEEQSAD